jgi:hypothetical protein
MKCRALFGRIVVPGISVAHFCLRQKRLCDKKSHNHMFPESFPGNRMFCHPSPTWLNKERLEQENHDKHRLTHCEVE